MTVDTIEAPKARRKKKPADEPREKATRGRKPTGQAASRKFLADWGEKIRERRKAAGLSMDQAGQRTGCGLSPASWSRYEAGQAEPSLTTFLLICFAVGARPDEMLPDPVPELVASGDFNVKPLLEAMERRPRKS